MRFPKNVGLQLDLWVHSFHATPVGRMLISPEVGAAHATPTYTKPSPLGEVTGCYGRKKKAIPLKISVILHALADG